MGRPVKYKTVAAQIESLIDAGSLVPGEPLPPEQALAQRFKVNRLTLRKAVGTLVEAGVVVRRPGSGTFVQPPDARGAQKGSLLYVGSTSEHFFQSFYEALCRQREQRGKGVTAFTPTANGDAMRQMRRLAESHSRLICMEETWRTVQDAIPRGVRVTRVSGADGAEFPVDPERPTYAVSADLYRAVKLAVEHLVAHGHRHIGYVDAGTDVVGDPMAGTVPPERLQYLGFLSGLRENGLEEICTLAIPHQLLMVPGVDFAAVHQRFYKYHLERQVAWPTAFVCVTDFRAGPLLRVLRDLGRRVPEDISLVGIGNTPWALALDPPLTSVCLGEAEMARMAILLNDEPEPERTRVVRVDPELVERQSVARAVKDEG